MAGLPLVSTREVIAALERAGYVHDSRRGRGSHHVLVRESPAATLVVPERREIPRGTLRAIIRQAGLTPEQFIELLR